MRTLAPSFPRASEERGVSATRRSPGKVSRGTPTVRATTTSSRTVVRAQAGIALSALTRPERFADGCSQTTRNIILPFVASRLTALGGAGAWGLEAWRDPEGARLAEIPSEEDTPGEGVKKGKVYMCAGGDFFSRDGGCFSEMEEDDWIDSYVRHEDSTGKLDGR